MGDHKWRLKAEQLVVEPFRLVTATLLSLLLPLSFLLLSRLSSAHFLLTTATPSLSSSPSSSSSSFFFSIFLNTNPALLYAVVSSISISTLVHGLTTKINSSQSNSDRSIIFRPRLEIAWIALWVLQVSVGLGIEGTISEGINGIMIGRERNFFSKVIFFLGLHEIMLLWNRVIVRPVVDDTLLGESRREETLVERVALAVSCGTLWWWKLRDEVEALVGVAETKRELSFAVGADVNNSNNFEVVDFMNWWLYYLVVTIGMVRVVKGFLWVGMVLLFKRVRRNSNGYEDDDDDDDDDGKV